MGINRAVVASVAVAGLLSAVVGCSSGSDASTASTATDSSNSTQQIVAVSISGGHDTLPADNGRPVVLVASILGVEPEVFREAFSHVSPAPADSEPEAAQVNLNKAALLASLGPYGITNDELDLASNHYRYNASAGEMWAASPTRAHAVVRDGVVVEIVVDDPGNGYTSAPTITVPGFPTLTVTASIVFTNDFATNGHIDSITITA